MLVEAVITPLNKSFQLLDMIQLVIKYGQMRQNLPEIIDMEYLGMVAMKPDPRMYMSTISLSVENRS